MFAVAHLALDRLRERGFADGCVLDLSRELHRTTLRIVEGQVLDLSFERRGDVQPAEYLTMIEGKTAAIMGYAAWSGARLADVAQSQTEEFRAFGLALGLGFQVQDDLLGIWGAPEVTGKSAADDIRRRKQSLPLLLLNARMDEADGRLLRALYAEGELQPDEIAVVLDLLERYEIRPLVETEVARWHGLAQDRLGRLTAQSHTPDILAGYVADLARRTA
jgi:geranylgeranyl diphosphate synthase type I